MLEWKLAPHQRSRKWGECVNICAKAGVARKQNKIDLLVKLKNKVLLCNCSVILPHNMIKKECSGTNVETKVLIRILTDTQA